MSGTWSVLKRELKGYFATPLAYVFLVIFLFFASVLTFRNGFYEMREASLRAFFVNMPVLFLFLVPAISMRLWAEERRTNSIEFLLTLPLTPLQAVLGKFFAAWAVLALALALTFPVAITVAYLGNPDWGPVILGYIGSLLLAGAFLAVGSLFSTVTKNQVIAFVLAVAVSALLVFAGNPTTLEYLSRVFPMGLVAAVESFSFLARFESLQRGVLELRDVAFFVLLTAGLLWANVVVLEERRAAG
ncbi:MAG: ABC transporter permease [Planctomycetota bacterium]